MIDGAVHLRAAQDSYRYRGAREQAGSKWANAEAASTAPADPRMNVRISPTKGEKIKVGGHCTKWKRCRR
jgi:hypothetical protein